jgi:DNA-binding NtrC family response regulator
VGRGNGELILVVDDEPSLRHGATEILTNAGYQVAAAANGAEAATLFAARAVEFALVLTDLDMPVLGGMALAGIIRESRPELKVLAMSGSSSRHASADPAYFAAGFIAKPFTAEMLLDYVERLLRGEPIPTHSMTPWPRS